MKRTEAIILSMTKQERQKPDILNGSRRMCIANGSGVKVVEVNQLQTREPCLEAMSRGQIADQVARHGTRGALAKCIKVFLASRDAREMTPDRAEQARLSGPSTVPADAANDEDAERWRLEEAHAPDGANEARRRRRRHARRLPAVLIASVPAP